MATKKTSGGPLRGAALVKKAIDASSKTLDAPEPVPASILKQLRLPNDEKLTPGLKAYLAHDSSVVGWSFDEDEPEFETVSLDELVEDEFGEDAVSAFGEACNMFDGDCIGIETDGEQQSFLYVGTPDDAGEYPVITIARKNAAWVGGFVPFDVWIAQHLGALARGETPGWVPDEYVPAAQALADANGDGRLSFESQPGDASGDDGDEEDDDDDDEDDDDDDDGKD